MEKTSPVPSLNPAWKRQPVVPFTFQRAATLPSSPMPRLEWIRPLELLVRLRQRPALHRQKLPA